MSEAQRINFLIERDGLEKTREWVKQTIRIYRRAVLHDGHFATYGEYRRKFIRAYLELKAWKFANAA